MFCLKCGEVISDDSKGCSVCNASVLESDNGEQAVVYASQGAKDLDKEKNIIKRKLSPKIIGIIAGVIILAIIGLSVNGFQKSALRKELLRGWLDTENSIIKVLDFSEDKVEYRLETGYSWMDTTVAKYDYKIISGNKIKIKRFGKYETFTIEFNDEKSMLTISPAITSTEKDEKWFNLD